MRKPAIPKVVAKDPALQKTLEAMKENIEVITARRGAKVENVPLGATLPQLITAFNELLDRLQG